MLFRRNEKKMVDTINLYKKVFSSEEGRKVLVDMAKATNIHGTSFDSDQLQMAFNEGQKAVVLRILRTIETDPEQLLQLIKQAGQSEE